MKTFRTLTTAAVVLTLAACATNPDKIAAQYVSSSEYLGLTCEQLEDALGANTAEADKLHKSMRSKKNISNTAAVVGTLLFWPAYFLLKGKDAESDSRMGELKGRDTAIHKSLDKLGC